MSFTRLIAHARTQIPARIAVSVRVGARRQPISIARLFCGIESTASAGCVAPLEHLQVLIAILTYVCYLCLSSGVCVGVWVCLGLLTAQARTETLSKLRLRLRFHAQLELKNSSGRCFLKSCPDFSNAATVWYTYAYIL